MARMWNSVGDAVEAADTLIIAYETTSGNLPADMLRAYKETLSRASHGMLMHFFTVITQRKPELLNILGEGEPVETVPNDDTE